MPDPFEAERLAQLARMARQQEQAAPQPPDELVTLQNTVVGFLAAPGQVTLAMRTGVRQTMIPMGAAHARSLARDLDAAITEAEKPVGESNGNASTTR